MEPMNASSHSASLKLFVTSGIGRISIYQAIRSGQLRMPCEAWVGRTLVRCEDIGSFLT